MHPACGNQSPFCLLCNPPHLAPAVIASKPSFATSLFHLTPAPPQHRPATKARWAAWGCGGSMCDEGSTGRFVVYPLKASALSNSTLSALFIGCFLSHHMSYLTHPKPHIPSHTLRATLSHSLSEFQMSAPPSPPCRSQQRPPPTPGHPPYGLQPQSPRQYQATWQ